MRFPTGRNNASRMNVVLACILATCSAAGPPKLSSFRTKFAPVVACPSTSSTPCPGFKRPQRSGRVPGDDATLCWHLGCCWTQSGLCVTATVAQGSDNQELWAGNQPIPALSNTRGSLQITIESGDALAVGCVYFPPFFSTCDGSRSDSRNPNSPVDATPTFAGVVQTRPLRQRPSSACGTSCIANPGPNPNPNPNRSPSPNPNPP